LNERNGVKWIIEDHTGADPARSGEHSREGCYSDRMVNGMGARIKDAEGTEYLDFCLANGSLVLGHQNDDFFEDIQHKADLTTMSGPREEMESNYSRMIHGAFPSMERSLFLGSGNVATDKALELARRQTGRKVIIMIAPDRYDLSGEGYENTIHVPFNDLDALTGALVKEEVAALFLEPVPCFPGPLVPEVDYLHQLREIADTNDLVLIFDETTTGFRLEMGGAQEHYRVRPDITILGKIAGGGYPIGIVGASVDMIETRSSKAAVLGSSISDPLSIAAGMATVGRLSREGHGRLNEMGEQLEKGLEAVLNEFHVRYKTSVVGSMFQLFLDPEGPQASGGNKGAYRELYPKVRDKLLENGVLFSPLQRGTNFISTAHTEEDIDDSVNAILVSLGEVAL
jgi:glutamate-1-semialdehyde 2,1-aminomutase